MKTAVCLFCIVLLTSVGLAIPDNIQQAFINPAGMRLEDFVNRPAMWNANAEVKGDWGNWNDKDVKDTSIEMQQLRMKAVVFGLDASLVTVQKRNNQPLRFEVDFKAEPNSRDSLTRQLITNISAWSGEAISLEKPTIDYESVRVGLAELGESIVRVSLEPVGP